MNLEDLSNDSIEDKAKCIGYKLSLWPITECGYKDNKRKQIIRLALYYNDVGCCTSQRSSRGYTLPHNKEVSSFYTRGTNVLLKHCWK